MFGLGRRKIKISVVSWDASFREYFHTVDYFCTQQYASDRFEFLWVDFYENRNSTLLDKIAQYPNARLMNLNNSRAVQWNLGVCINEGVKAASGDILVIPDGDIVVPGSVLSAIERDLEGCDDLVLYFRRWNEPVARHDETRSYDLDYLKDVCVMTNPTNYGGLLALRRKTLLRVNGYEENPVFSGPGANGFELYIRLRNAGLPIRWHDERIYHPSHVGTGWSNTDKELMTKLSEKYPWIMPYAGIEQSWVIKSRESDLSFTANDGSIERYLTRMPKIQSSA